MLDNKLSVIIPVYPNFKFLQRALDSLTKQGIKYKEVICILDGFKSSKEEEYFKENYKDLNIQFLYHDKNMSAFQAKLTGCKNVTGDFVVFLDKDDELEEGLYGRALQKLIDCNADVVGFDITNKIFKYEGVCHNNIECSWLFFYRFKNSLFNLVTYIFKSSIVKKGIEELLYLDDIYLNYCEDILFLMVFFCNSNVIVEDWRLGIYHYHLDNTDSTCYKMKIDPVYNLKMRQNLFIIRNIIRKYLCSHNLTWKEIRYKEDINGIPLYDGVKPYRRV